MPRLTFGRAVAAPPRVATLSAARQSTGACVLGREGLDRAFVPTVVGTASAVVFTP